MLGSVVKRVTIDVLFYSRSTPGQRSNHNTKYCVPKLGISYNFLIMLLHEKVAFRHSAAEINVGFRVIQGTSFQNSDLLIMVLYS